MSHLDKVLKVFDRNSRRAQNDAVTKLIMSDMLLENLFISLRSEAFDEGTRSKRIVAGDIVCRTHFPLETGAPNTLRLFRIDGQSGAMEAGNQTSASQSRDGQPYAMIQQWALDDYRLVPAPGIRIDAYDLNEMLMQVAYLYHRQAFEALNGRPSQQNPFDARATFACDDPYEEFMHRFNGSRRAGEALAATHLVEDVVLDQMIQNRGLAWFQDHPNYDFDDNYLSGFIANTRAADQSSKLAFLLAVEVPEEEILATKVQDQRSELAL